MPLTPYQELAAESRGGARLVSAAAGSGKTKVLVERHNLGVSSATVRNDMAVLEAEGYITQPHTSSGRVPTDKGYRQFVDRISEVKPLSPQERAAILRFLEEGVDLDDVLRRSVDRAPPTR